MNFVVNEIKSLLPQAEAQKITNLSKRNFSSYFARLSHKVYHEYNLPTDALYQAIFALRLHVNTETLTYSSKLILKYIFGYRYIRRIFRKYH